MAALEEELALVATNEHHWPAALAGVPHGRNQLFARSEIQPRCGRHLLAARSAALAGPRRRPIPRDRTVRVDAGLHDAGLGCYREERGACAPVPVRFTGSRRGPLAQNTGTGSRRY